MNNRLQFFTDRIGKKVFRNHIKDLGEDTQLIKGITVLTERHAKGLFEIEEESKGLFYYFDSKEEAKKYNAKDDCEVVIDRRRVERS